MFLKPPLIGSFVKQVADKGLLLFPAPLTHFFRPADDPAPGSLGRATSGGVLPHLPGCRDHGVSLGWPRFERGSGRGPDRDT